MSKNSARGIFKENPLFTLFLGLCPVLAITTKVINALGMSVCVILVLLCSCFFISLLRNFITDKIRIPAQVIIIAFFVILVELLMEAYFPSLFKSLGLFIPLIVVNCLILGRISNFAVKNRVSDSISTTVGMSLGYTLGMLTIALIRETLGAGTITLFPMFGFNGVIKLPLPAFGPMKVLVLAPGALLVTGYLIAFITWLEQKKRLQIRNNENVLKSTE